MVCTNTTNMITQIEVYRSHKHCIKWVKMTKIQIHDGVTETMHKIGQTECFYNNLVMNDSNVIN